MPTLWVLPIRLDINFIDHPALPKTEVMAGIQNFQF